MTDDKKLVIEAINDERKSSGEISDYLDYIDDKENLANWLSFTNAQFNMMDKLVEIGDEKSLGLASVMADSFSHYKEVIIDDCAKDFDHFKAYKGELINEKEWGNWHKRDLAAGLPSLKHNTQKVG